MRVMSTNGASSTATSQTLPLDNAMRLNAQVDSNGVATVDVVEIKAGDLAFDGRAKPKAIQLDLSNRVQRKPRCDETLSESASEDYDSLRHDHSTIVNSGTGGGFDGNDEPKSNSAAGEKGTGSNTYTSQGTEEKQPGSPKLKNVPMILEKADENGRYILRVDNADLKEIIRLGAEYPPQTSSTKRRTKFSDLVFTRQFTAFDRQNSAIESPFRGFFTLFWLAVVIFMFQIAGKNWETYGHIFGSHEILTIMFKKDMIVLGLSDGVMCGVTGFGWLLQRAILAGWLSWDGAGWIIQSVWELFFLFCVISWTLYRSWTWPPTVFFVLHGLVMLMKQHSYAFYNGHLSEVHKSHQFLEYKLKQLRDIAPADTPSATTPSVDSLSTGYLEQTNNAGELNQRRRLSTQHNFFKSNNPTTPNDLGRVAQAIESGEPLDIEQIRTFERILRWEIDALDEELRGKASTPARSYPNNLTFADHYNYIVLPTLVYELEYPRTTEDINWGYVVEKSAATFGGIAVMILVSQAFIYPVVVKTVIMKEAQWSLSRRLLAFPGILNDLLFPFLMEYLMAWYVIWECILNVLAELTHFADRGFYGDWWNSISWDQFARDWNRVVHNFLLRHVYHSSISSLKVPKSTATLITFFLSALVHELIMWCLFKKLRGYLLFMQMLQIPLVQLSGTKWLKGRKTLGNVIFWTGIATGPSLLCSLYLII